MNELVNNMAELRNRLQALQVQSAHPLTERLLLQQLAWPESQRLEAIEALRAKLSHTTHEPLQQLYQQPSAKLATVDQHCLLLALQAAAKNSFITYEAQAVHLQRRGRILRTAAALERCTLLYKWWSRLLEREGRFWLLLSGLGIAFLLASGALHRGPGGIGLINAAIWLLPAAGFWYCRRHFVSLLRKDIQAHDPGMAAYSPWSVLLLRNRTTEWASNGGAVEISPLKELKEVNRQIAALPGITPSNYTVQLASLKRANAALCGVAALLLLAWTQSNILPGFRLPQRFGFSGQPSSRRPLAPGTVPIPWRGQTIVCWINNANAVSGSNGQPRNQAHRTLIYNRPIVIEGGIVHDLTLHSSYPVFIHGSARQVEINTSHQLVIEGDLVDSSVIAAMVEVHGNVRHSKIRGRSIQVSGIVDAASTVTHVPASIPLPPPRRF